jgi:hypothetical protein
MGSAKPLQRRCSIVTVMRQLLCCLHAVVLVHTMRMTTDRHAASATTRNIHVLHEPCSPTFERVLGAHRSLGKEGKLVRGPPLG